jgi:predicted ArsR family transcriptional regulator
MGGAAELVPYLCRTDYVMSTALGIHLVRTQTIADGADCCDFWFYRS